MEFWVHTSFIVWQIVAQIKEGDIEQRRYFTVSDLVIISLGGGHY